MECKNNSFRRNWFFKSKD